MRKLIFKITALITSSVLTVVLVLAGVYLYVNMKIKDPEFRWENQIDMWDPDPDIGYVNKANFKGYAHGIIPIETDKHGFRLMKKPSNNSEKRQKRIVYMGDSEMWGVGIENPEDTIPGMIQKKLGSDAIVMNAGVVGYSTFQELRFLEKVIIPLQPDEVVINWCYNDYLPTEDPFDLNRDIHIKNIDSLPGIKHWSEPDRAVFDRVKANFNNREQRVWDQVTHSLDIEMKLACLTACVDVPVQRIAKLCRDNGIRLCYVVIPSQAFNEHDQHIYKHYCHALWLNKIDYVDMVKPLLALRDPTLIPEEFEEPEQAPEMVPETPAWQPVWLTHFTRILAMKQRNRSKIFIDPHHTTVRANRIIADEMLEWHTKAE